VPAEPARFVTRYHTWFTVGIAVLALWALLANPGVGTAIWVFLVAGAAALILAVLGTTEGIKHTMDS
jgi:hypothetical protein